MPQTKTKRPISVRVAVGFVLVAAALAVLSKLGLAWSTLTGTYLWTDGTVDPRLPLDHLPQINQAEIRDGYSFYLDDLPGWLRALSATPALLYALTIALAAVLIARMLRLIASGDAFGTDVRRTLTVLASTLVGGGVLHGVVDSVASWRMWHYISPRLDPGDEVYAIQGFSGNVPDWPIMLIVLGLICVALTIAFRQGAQLREEMAGVI